MSHASLLVALDKVTDLEQNIEEAMSPFDENAGWFESGTRWDWYVIGGRWDNYKFDGNIIQVKELHPNKLLEKKRGQAIELWEKLSKEKGAGLCELIYGYPKNTTKDAIIKERTATWFPSHFAFLHNGKWHERERMGWFGVSAKTECEIKSGESVANRCKAKAKNAPDAYIVSWGDDEKSWDFKFYDRFIKPLSPETTLVTVDYHV